MARTEPQINIRIPADLKAALDREAEASRRSLTAEIVARLQASLGERERGVETGVLDGPEAQRQFVQDLRTRQALVLGRREALHSQRFTMQIQMGMAESSIHQLQHTARTADPGDRAAITELGRQVDQVRRSVLQLERELTRVEKEIEMCDSEMLHLDRTLEEITGQPQVLIKAYLARDDKGPVSRRAAGAALLSPAGDTTPEPEHTAPAKKAGGRGKTTNTR